jgi:hypothetical protein
MVYLMTMSVAPAYGRMVRLMNDESERMWKEAVVS